VAVEVIAFLRRFFDWLFRRVRPAELPAFTVNLDDTEAQWEAEALDEWDRALQTATGKLPTFSRLYAPPPQRRITEAQADAFIREVNRPVGAPVLVGRPPGMEALYVCTEGHHNTAIGCSAQPVDEVERYNDLLRAKGIDPAQWHG
jgi:hypothetical protein